jgi:hypothetical protein
MERDAFKGRVTAPYRGAVATKFLHVIRGWPNLSSADTVRAVFLYYMRYVSSRHFRVENLLIRLINKHFDEAVAYVAFLKECEASPVEARRKRKRYRESMRNETPTVAQARLLRNLNVRDTPATRLEASDLIDTAIQARELAQRLKTSITWAYDED